MTIARDRVIGILIGDFVSYLVFTRVWPVSVDQGRRSRDQRAAHAPGRDDDGSRRISPAAVAAEVLASRDVIETNLELADYEPRSTRPPPGWQRRRLEAVRAILALTGPLLLSADRTPALSTEFGRRLRAVAPAPDDAEPPPTDTGRRHDKRPDRAEADAVRGLLDRNFQRLELAMAERHASA